MLTDYWIPACAGMTPWLLSESSKAPTSILYHVIPGL
jgi:hypothetical protein